MFGWFLNTLCKITEVSRLHCVDFNYVFVIKFLIATNQQKITTKSFTYYHIYFVTILRCILFTFSNANNNLCLHYYSYTITPPFHMLVCPEKSDSNVAIKRKTKRLPGLIVVLLVVLMPYIPGGFCILYLSKLKTNIWNWNKAILELSLRRNSLFIPFRTISQTTFTCSKLTIETRQ